ncbi:MAG: ABC transporter ATP-binding protein [Casimicrobiaceae bacterium]
MTIPRLEVRQITKRYPAVLANDRVSLAVAPGEIHAVLGENGAGKSTLMKIIYGAVAPDAGMILWDGRPVALPNPRAARALGIAMVFQHFSLFDTLTVAENVWLGLDRRLPLAEVRRRIAGKAASYGLPIEADPPVHALSVGERQRVEILRALLAEPRLLILDEPTSVLTPQAVATLFATLRQLAAEGCAILYISHKLDEIRALCTACTVLRGGRVTGTVDPRTSSNAELSRLMIGSEPPRLARRTHSPGEAVLEVEHLSLAAADPYGTALADVSFTLRAGEVVGIAGVSGNGQQELLAALSGEDTRAPAGSIRLLGHAVGHRGPRARRALGLAFVPEERLGRGAVPMHTLAQNTLLTRAAASVSPRLGWLSAPRRRALAKHLIERFTVKAGGVEAAAASLSGGNLQKYLVGREIDAEPRCLIIAQPTWGVDVGAAALIRREIAALAERGAAVLVVSEELDELFELCDRLHVIARGRLSPALPVAEATVEQIGAWMSGLWQEQPSARGQEAAHASA